MVENLHLLWKVKVLAACTKGRWRLGMLLAMISYYKLALVHVVKDNVIRFLDMSLTSVVYQLFPPTNSFIFGDNHDQ